MTYEHKLYTISGGASSQYGFDFDYIDESEVKVEVDGSEITAFNVNGNTINFEGHQVPTGTTLIVSRKTDLSQSKVKFAAGSAIRAGDLNTLTNQLLYSAQETEFKQLDITKAPGNVDEGTRSSIKASTNDADGLYDYIGKWMDQNGSFSYKLQVSQSAPQFRGDGSPLAQGDLWIDTGNGSLYYYWQTGTDPNTNTVINGWVETTLDPTTINHLATFAGVVGGDFQDCGNITDTTGSPGSAVNFATIADNITAINTVAGISADIDALVDSNGTALSDLQVVANDITTLADLGSVATSVTTTPGANYISEVGQNIADVTAVAGQITPTNNIASVVSNAADITTVAGSINALNRYADEYLIAAEDVNNSGNPVLPAGWTVVSGDLWYDTTNTQLKYYTGSAWNATGGAQGPQGQGWTSGSYNATTGQVTFNSTFPALQFSTGNLKGADGNDGNDGTLISYAGTAPNSPATNDFWIDSNSTNKTLSQYTGGQWNNLFNIEGSTGPAGANGTLISYAGTAPGSPATNDFWIDSSTANNTLKQYNGTVWSDLFDIEGSDGAAGTNGTNGADGADGADGTEIYYQTTQPTGGNNGDFWVDSDSTGKELWRRESGTWNQKFQMGMDLTPTQLSDVSAVANDLAQNNDLGLISNNVTNTNTGGSLQTVVSNLSDINAFNNRYQIAAAGPSTRSNSTALVEGDLYFDTTTDVLRAYDGSTWGNVTLTSAQLTDVSAVANDISQNNDLGSITVAASNTGTGGSLQTCASNIADINTVAAANSNIQTVVSNLSNINSFADTYFISASAPGSPTVGDLWFDSTNSVLKYYANSTWTVIQTGYGNSDVDAHLNQSSASNGQLLSWNGSDYDWIAAPSTYGDSDVDAHLSVTTGSASGGGSLSYNAGTFTFTPAAIPTAYTNTNVDSHLNRSSAGSGQILSWNGSDYAWVNDNNTTYSVGDGGLTQKNFTTTLKTKLDGIATGAEVNVQSDWNASSGDAQILNKPTIPTNNNQLTNGAGYITSTGTDENFTTALKNKLNGIASGAEVNVQSDWTASSGDAEILNKPTIPTTLGGLSDVSTSGASNTNLLGYNGTSWEPVTAPSGTTNLGIGTITSTTVPVTSSTGTDATLPAATQSDAGVMSSTDKTKLDGVETGATADQTAAEIRTLVEAATDSNVFTDADHTKLNGITTGATAYSNSDVDSRLASYTGAAADYILSRNSSNNGFEWVSSGSSGSSLTAQQLTDVNTVATDLASSNDLGSIASALTNSSTGGALNTCATNITDIQTVAASFSATGTLSDTSLDNFSETVTTGTNTATLNAATAHVYDLTYNTNTTVTLTLNTGQSILAHVNAGANTVTFSSVNWIGGSAPTLNTSGDTVIEFWKIGTTIYGAAVGDI